MIERRTGNVLEAEAEAVVNTVNCKGVMGKGIALLMKQTYPENYKRYRDACKAGEVQIGRMFTVELPQQMPLMEPQPQGRPRYVINFPTKKHWRNPSRLSYIEAGLTALVAEVKRLSLRSIAVPALGCGNGGLDWEEVRPLIVTAFVSLRGVRVLLYDPYTEEPDGSRSFSDGAAEAEPSLSPEEAALVRVTRAYAAEAYRLSAREMELLQELLACAGPVPAPPRSGATVSANWWLIPGETDGEPELSVHPAAVRAAEQVLQGASAAAAAQRVQQLITGWETPYSLEVLATVHRLAHRTPGATPAEMMASDEWREPVRRLLQAEHVARARQHLEREGWLLTAAVRVGA